MKKASRKQAKTESFSFCLILIIFILSQPRTVVNKPTWCQQGTGNDARSVMITIFNHILPIDTVEVKINLIYNECTSEKILFTSLSFFVKAKPCSYLFLSWNIRLCHDPVLFMSTLCLNKDTEFQVMSALKEVSPPALMLDMTASSTICLSSKGISLKAGRFWLLRVDTLISSLP